MEPARQPTDSQQPTPTGEPQGEIPGWLLTFMRSQQETNLRLEQGIAQLRTMPATTATPSLFTDPQPFEPGPIPPVNDDSYMEKKPRHSLTHPDKYTGEDETTFPQFRGLLEAKLEIDRKAIGTEKECIWYAYGRLAGTAAGRIYPWMDYSKNTPLFTLREFLKQLDTAFADPQKQSKALGRINRIRQGNREFREFLRDFEQTLLEAQGWKWEDQVRKGYLRAAINRELRDRLITQVEPLLYTDYVSQLRMIADNLQEMKAWSSQRIRFNHPRAYVTDQQLTRSSVKDEMEWEPTRPHVAAVPPTHHTREAGIKRAPQSTSEQRDEWRKKGGCVRCGSMEHWVSDCGFEPYRPRNGPQRPQRSGKPQLTARKPQVAAVKAPKAGQPSKVVELTDSETEWESVEDSGKE